MERADETKFLRGWMHINRTVFYEVVQDIIQEYIVLYREYGKTIDVTVDELPGALYNQFNLLVDGHGLEVYEKQGQSGKHT